MSQSSTLQQGTDFASSVLNKSALQLVDHSDLLQGSQQRLLQPPSSLSTMIQAEVMKQMGSTGSRSQPVSRLPNHSQTHSQTHSQHTANPQPTHSQSTANPQPNHSQHTANPQPIHSQITAKTQPILSAHSAPHTNLTFISSRGFYALCCLCLSACVITWLFSLTLSPSHCGCFSVFI